MKRPTSAMMMALCIILFSSFTMYAQQKPAFITVTKAHWNMNLKDFSMDEWKKIEGEYHQKVVMKNEFIAHSNVLLHYYTPDNSEILLVSVYNNWEDIEKANDRNNELAKEAWPDKDARTAFFDNQRKYYSNLHSDEIYSGLSLSKDLTSKPDEPLIYYVRKTHRAFPEDGTNEEIQSLRKEFLENVVYKNDDIMAYYPMRHLWGSDSREIVDVIVTKSLADLEDSNKNKQGELIKAHWPDEEKRKAFFEAFNKYTEPWHGDWVYTNVPELMK